MTPWDDALVLTGAIAGGITVTAALMTRVYKVLRRIDDAIGVDENGRSLSQRLHLLESAITPVGRDPLPARVDQIEADVQRTQRAVERIGDKLDTIESFVLQAPPHGNHQ